MTTTATLADQNQRVVIEPVYSKGFINIYDVGPMLDCAAVIADVKKGDWGESAVTGRDGSTTSPIVKRAIRDSSQQNFPSINSPRVHCPVLRYSAKCLENYLEMFPQANNFPRFAVQEDYNILRYTEGQAYHSVHTDFTPDFQSFLSRRHLTGICFLNDVTDGGDLTFPQQDLSIRPEAGKFVIFPSGWTHAHGTLPPVGQTRYVFQLWWSFS